MHLAITLVTLIFLSVAGNSSLAQGFAVPNQPGPFAVGHDTFRVTDANRNERQLDVDVWYPGIRADDSKLTSYRMITSLDFAFPSSTAYRSLPVDVSAPRSLLISSHGTMNYSTSQASVNEALASHGFIVVAPNHTGNSLSNNNRSETDVAPDRIRDVGFLIDNMLARNNDPQDPFFGTVHEQRIGVMGLSYGGVTTVASHLGSADLGIPGDPRIKAIMPISPGLFEWMKLSSSTARSTVPSLFLNGTLDFTLSDSRAALNATASPDRFLAIIDNARHLSYMHVCDWNEYAKANKAPGQIAGFLSAIAGTDWQTCAADAIDNQTGISLTSQLAVSFFRAYLNGESEYLPFLTADNVRESNLPVTMVEFGDVNFDGYRDATDIDQVTRQIRRNRFSAQYDIDRNQTIDRRDHELLVHGVLNTYFGDSNLDRQFDSGDMIQVFQSKHYEDGVAANSGWATGDWDGDGDFTTSDMVVAFQDGGYEKGPRAAVTAIPEPTSGIIVFMGWIVIWRLQFKNDQEQPYA